MKGIEIQNLQDVTDSLNRRKEDLIGEKQDSEIKNEELRTQLKAQQDVAHKRLMAKLNRDKTQEIKELLIQQEALKEFNDNLTNKLTEEKEKFNKFSDEKITIDEKLRLLLLNFKDDTEFTEV